MYLVTVALAVALLGVTAAQWTQPPPLVDEGLVFFSPHPDDETYAAALTLAANARAGRRVVVVLLTDGEQSKDASWWLEEHARDLDQDGDRDRWDFGLARRAEFIASMERLGVTETVFLGAADSQGARGLEDKELAGSDLPAIVADTMARYPEETPMTVMKAVDGDTYLGDKEAHPDHTAL
ncbi:MAG: PIG-L family deacetylase, partial [Coriobacteriia bacterium]|nr:PIG-L family deacetylase [Coriobacteriia bacterium]